MEPLRILVISEGESELGHRPPDVGDCWECSPDALPALPRIVARSLPKGAQARFAVCRWKTHFHTHVRDEPAELGQVKMRGIARKAMHARVIARRGGFGAMVIVIDCDKLDYPLLAKALEAGACSGDGPAAATGVAVRTFDAWMICDHRAVKAAGGDHTHCRPESEKLQGKENTGTHPKDVARRVFGEQGLSAAYQAVAEHADLSVLRKCCQQGFAPFAQAIEEQIHPLFAGR